jgi:putative membrane protein
MKTRWIMMIGVVLALALLAFSLLGPAVFPAAFGGGMYGRAMGPGMMGGYGVMGGFGGLGMIVMALFWIGAIVLVVWGVSRLFPSHQPNVGPDALEILKQRYARGEISREEFTQASETLR